MRRALPRSSQTVTRDRLVEKAPVVADDDERRLPGVELAFQPFDRRQVEMIGRLVEQQDVGRRRQHAGERGAARLAARQRRRVFVAAQAELLQQIARRVAIVVGPETRLDVIGRGGEAGKIRLLRQVADGRVGLEEDGAAVGLDQPGGDLEQRRFARAVAADEAHALAGRDQRGRRRRAAACRRRSARCR